MEKPEDDDESGVSLYLQFRVVTCDQCGRSVDPQSEACVNCGEPFELEEESDYSSVDPHVEARSRALKSILAARDLLLARLSEEPSSSCVVADEDLYSDHFSDFNRRTEVALDAYKNQVNHLDLRTDYLETNGAEFAEALIVLEQYARVLVEVAEETRRYEFAPGWRQLHKAFAGAVLSLVVEHLKLLDAAVAPTFNEAQEQLVAFREGTSEALDDLEIYRRTVLAGRLINAGAADFGEVVADIAAEGVGFDEWSEIGTRYFRGILRRPADELAPEAGLLLATSAIHTSSCDDPEQILTQAGAVVSLLRQAGDADKARCKEAIRGAADHLLKAIDHLMSAQRQIDAMDHSRLLPRDEFEIAIRLYHRVSEGLFQSLLNLMVFAERVGNGKGRDFSEVANWKFGCKIRRESGGIEGAKDPLVAALASSLLLFVRHSDSHLSHTYSGDKMQIPETDSRGRLLDTHEYTLEEFIARLRRLVEACTAMAIGSLVFVIERHEVYWECLPQDGLGELRAEIVAMIAAMEGVVVENLCVMETNALAMVIRGPESGRGLTIQQILSVTRTAWSSYRTVDSVDIVVTSVSGSSTLTVSADHFRKYEGAEGSPRLQRLYICNALLEASESNSANEVWENNLGEPNLVFPANVARAVSETYEECQEYAVSRTSECAAWCESTGRELRSVLKLLEDFQMKGNQSPLIRDMVGAVRDLRKFISRKKASLRKRRATGKAGYMRPLERVGTFVEYMSENFGIGEDNLDQCI